MPLRKFKIAIILLAAAVGLGCNLPGLVRNVSTSIPSIPSIPSPPIGSTPTFVPVEATPSANLQSAGDSFTSDLGNSGYEVRHYLLQLSLDPSNSFLTGKATIDALAMEDHLSDVWLDFTGFKIDSIILSGQSVPFERIGNKVVAHPQKPLSAGQFFTLAIPYSGSPLVRPSKYIPFLPHLGIFSSTQHTTLFVLSEPDGAQYWFPCNDHPRNKATYRFELLVPSGYTAVANGNLISTRLGIPDAFSGGKAGDLFTWEHNYPMATYLATVAVGKYQLVESKSPNGIPLRSYILPDSLDTFRALSAEVGVMIDWMSSQFGPYPFDSFGYVTSSGVSESLETQSMVLLSNQNITEEIIAHEMSHMWFGDWVSLDSWGEIWRNEGLATYIAQMWLMRKNPAGLNAVIKEYKQTVKSNPSGHALKNPPPADMFGRDTYTKGAVLVSELRKAMGDQTFFNGLRAYISQYGGKTASDAQFQEVMEQAAGKSLQKVLDTWLK